MPTNGMTIDSLNTVSSLTAQDEVPVWDKEASGEPTRKITAQNMTNSVKTLGSLVNTTEMNNAIAQSTADVIRTGDVVNSLTSTATDKPLSANMGKALNDTLLNNAKIYRINVTSGETASNSYFPLSVSYIADNFVSIQNGNEIHFGASANVLVLVSIIGAAVGGTRGWVRLEGGNTSEDAIAYGNYSTLIISALYAVDTSTVLKIKNIDEVGFNVGGGGISGSRIKIIRL